MTNFYLSVSSSPHIKNKRSTRSIMADVLIALTPAMAMSMIYYGNKALWQLVACVSIAVLSEYFWNYFMKKEQTIHDLSAAVTGVLIALNLSPITPFWIGAIGSFFAIVIVKLLFGGIGQNFVNPALAARAFLMASWPVQMTTFIPSDLDAVSGPTVMQALKMQLEPSIGIRELLLGHGGGCLGETSALALLIGAAYLVYRGVIRLELPIVYILTTGLLCTAFAPQGFFQGQFLYQVLGGGLLIGAFFMANDYTTSPMTRKGELIYAFCCGLLTFIIRRFGGYPEGVSYSILIMNLFVPLIDRFTVPRSFGEEAKHGKKA